MKPPRTPSQVFNLLDADFGWRLREISIIRSAIGRAAGLNRDALLRAAIPLLYAHWEGFIKFAAVCYTEYLSSLGVAFSNLDRSFCGLSAIAVVQQLGGITKQIFSASTLLMKLHSIDQDKAYIPLQKHISNVGNLKFDTFEQISLFLSLDTKKHTSKRKLIDELLVKRRNEIAHGEYLNVDPKGFESLSNEIIDLMREFKTDIQNAVSTKGYLRNQKDKMMLSDKGQHVS